MLAFNKVADHYECPADERQIMTTLARENPEDAKRCFKALADEIDALEPPVDDWDGVSAAEMVIERSEKKEKR